MRGSTAVVAAAALFAALVVESRLGHGTSYSPLTADECPATGTLTPGTTVFLFHSGTEETRLSIRAGDVMAVLRPGVSAQDERVGTIRVETAVGRLCFRADVLSGELRQHDVALAGVAAYLLLAADAPCLREADR